MLVLSRKVGEKIIVADNVTIVINRIAGHRVSLGITAPRGTRIVRSELGPREASTDGQAISGGQPGENGFSDPTHAFVGPANPGVDAHPAH